MTYTPGPWSFFEDEERQGHVYSANNCTIHELFEGTERDRANAILIAAAPELLEALESIADQLERVGDSRKDRPFVESARRAIAKAKGFES